MRIALVALVAVLGAACAGVEPQVPATPGAGAWRVESQPDAVTRAPVPSAVLVTANSVNTSEALPRPAVLQLTCFKGAPLVRFVFQFRIGSTAKAVFGYAFDDRPGRDVEVTFVYAQNTVLLDKRAEVERFARELADAKTLTVRIRALNAGRTTAEFRVEGAPAAIAAGFAGCPLRPRDAKRTS